MVVNNMSRSNSPSLIWNTSWWWWW